MLDGVMLLWFILTAISFLFVAIDIWRTPEANVMRWGFIILTLFTIESHPEMVGQESCEKSEFGFEL